MATSSYLSETPIGNINGNNANPNAQCSCALNIRV